MPVRSTVPGEIRHSAKSSAPSRRCWLVHCTQSQFIDLPLVRPKSYVIIANRSALKMKITAPGIPPAGEVGGGWNGMEKSVKSGLEDKKVEGLKNKSTCSFGLKLHFLHFIIATYFAGWFSSPHLERGRSI